MPGLKRTLGIIDIVLCGVGIIVGAGIYVLLGEAVGLAGNGIWISFLIAAVLSVFTGLSYAELSSMFPKAGAEYVYTEKSFGRHPAFLVGWLIFLGGVISAAAVALGFGSYLSNMAGVPAIPAALAVILIASAISYIGIKQSARVADAFAVIETLGLIAVIVLGLPFLGKIDYLDIPSAGGVMSAAALVFFAFIGFENIVRLSEETKNPTKTIPKALLLAIAITTVIYVAVAIASVSILDWHALGKSTAPMADIAAAAGMDPRILSFIALFSTANTVLLILVGTARTVYGMAAAHTVPKFLGRVDPKTGTPWMSIILMMLFSMAFVFLGDIGSIANLTNFTVFLTFIIINACVIVLRYRVKKRPFRVPLNIGKFPLISLAGVLVSLVMLLSVGWGIFALGTALALAGSVLYMAFVKLGHLPQHRKKTRAAPLKARHFYHYKHL